MITKENWTHCIYKNPLSTDIAQISVGAKLDNNNSYTEIFYVSHFDPKHYPEYQIELTQIEEALEVINKRYNSWSFVDLEKQNSKKSGGCDSCQAH